VIPSGHVLVYDPELLNCPYQHKDGRIYEHHRTLYLAGVPFNTKTQVVHHKDENMQNNRLDNLEVMSRSEHSVIHNWFTSSKSSGGSASDSLSPKVLNDETRQILNDIETG
jgi:hypothetical protein